MATRTGVSSLRTILRELCKLTAHFPGLLSSSEIPAEIKAALIGLIAVCLASEFSSPHAGEVSN